MRRPGCEIARETGVSPSTISRILRAARLSRARDLDPPEPARRYEHQHPGDMIHLDIKKLGRFERIGHRVTGDRSAALAPRERVRAAAGSLSTSVSRTPRVSPLPRSIPMKKPQARLLISKRQSPTFKASGSASGASSPTMARATNLTPSAMLAAISASSTSVPSHIHPEPTARLSASSRPRFANGPMPAPTKPQISAPKSCQPGCIDITGIDHTAALKPKHLSVASAYPRTTC